MNAIVWKELREHARWVPFAMCLMFGIVWYVFDQSQLILDPDGNLMFFTACFGGVCAFLLGVAQCWGDRSPESRALLLHRGVTPTGAFLSKLVAAILMYSTAILVPLGCAAVYLFVDGLQTIAAYPVQLIGSVFSAAVAFLFWPAGVLVMHRPAVVYGSRFFPVGGALVFCQVGVWMLLSGEADFLSCVAVCFIAVCFIAVGWAFFWFASSEAFVDRAASPRGRVSLWAGNTIFLVVFVFVALEFVHTYQWSTPEQVVYSTESNYVALGHDGELWRVRDLVQVEGWSRSIQKTQVAKLTEDGSAHERLKEDDAWNALSVLFAPLSGTDHIPDGRIFGSSFQSVCNNVLYNKWRDELVVYDQNGKSAWLRKSLRPADGEFGGLGKYNFTSYPTVAYSFEVQSEADPPRGRYIRFRNGLYYLSADRSKVELVHPASMKHFGSVDNPDAYEVSRIQRDRDRLTMLHTGNLPGKKLETTLLGPFDGTYCHRTEIRLPAELADVEQLELAKVPDSTADFVAVRRTTELDGTRYSWFRFAQDGKVLAKKEFFDDAVKLKGNVANLYPDPHYEAVVPPVLFATFGLLQAVIAPDVLQQSMGEDKLEWAVFGIILLLQSVAALLIAMVVVRYRRVDPALWKRWYIAAFLCGPFSALCILTVYPRIISELCKSCSKPTPIDQTVCVSCNQPLDELELTGVEIFDRVEAKPMVAATV